MGGAFLLPSNQSQIYQSIVSPIIYIIRRKKLKEKAISSFNYTDYYCSHEQWLGEKSQKN